VTPAIGRPSGPVTVPETEPAASSDASMASVAASEVTVTVGVEVDRSDSRCRAPSLRPQAA